LAISKARKDELLEQYTTLIDKSSAVFFAEYSGMSVKAMDDLRGKVYEADGAFHVTKNTLISLALQNADREVPADLLQGQLATGFALNEVPAIAKALVDYAEKSENLSLKGGFLGNRFLTAAEIEALAKLPSIDQLRAQILGLVNAPARNVASVVASGVRQLVNVVDAYSKSEESAAEAA
jgi:large subunit ribosomal protein L10